MSAERFYAQPIRKGSDIEINVLGDMELTQLFQQLKMSQQKSIQISAFRAATKPLLQDAKSNLLARTKGKAGGSLHKSLGAKPHRSLPILKIGARRGGNFAGYHGHLIDEGTKLRQYTTKKGVVRKTGSVSATNFWIDAVDKNERAALESVGDQIIKAFHRYIKRYNKRQKT